MTQELEKAVAEPNPMTCASVLESPPSQTVVATLTDYVPLKHLAYRDDDGDGEWNRLCVPFFPKKLPKIVHNYRAVLVCFNGVGNREALDELIDSGELEVNFWPSRQKLDVAIHSQLAQQYTTMDLANSPVFYHGFKAANPLLGETSLYASAGCGSVALFVALLAMIFGLFTGKNSPDLDVESIDFPKTNRAGLPSGDDRAGPPSRESSSFLDQIATARSALSE